MKKSLLALSTLLLVSTYTMADSADTMVETNMRTSANYTLTSTLLSEPTTSREKAYQQGYKIMDNLQDKSPVELINILKINRYNLDTQSVMIVDKEMAVKEIAVKEYSKQPNNIQYQALVEVNSHYRKYQSDNQK